MPSPPPDLLVRGLDDFVAAAAAASRSGPAGEAALVRALDLLPVSRRELAVAYLGDARGPAGPPTLRRVLAADRASRDERCAAIVALAKRQGERAASDFARAFLSRDAGVKAYALAALAAYGDERVRPHVATYLARRLHRDVTFRQVPSPTVLAVTYLARYSDRNRMVALAGLLREAEPGLRAEEFGTEVLTWLEKFWPACLDPGVEARRVAVPDAVAMQEWIRRHPIFDPVKEL